MKRILVTLPVFLILLWGCSTQPEATLPPTDPPALEIIAATESSGIYDPDSYLEAQTEGAIRMYPLHQLDSIGFLPMGQDLVLFSASGGTTITKYTGDDLSVAAVASLNCFIYPTDPAVQVSESGVTYYDERQNSLVILDHELREVKRLPLPEDICGTPALTADRRFLYYCTKNALRCMDTETGLDRFLKEMTYPEQSVASLHCDDAVIGCAVTDENGNHYQLYIRAENGQLLQQSSGDTRLWTKGDVYFAIHPDGVYPELLTGDSEQGPTLLAVDTFDRTVFPALGCGGIVIAPEKAENALQLDFYRLRSGRCEATVTLPGAEPVWSVQAMGDDTVWFLRYDARYGCEVLHRWDLSKTPTNDDVSHLSARYTADRPDLRGIAECRAIADTLFEVYGVRILLWNDAAFRQPSGYTLIPEYQVTVIRRELTALEEMLYLYPEGFLQKAAESTANGYIEICLVRCLTDDRTGTAHAGLQYWDSSANAYLCLAAQETQPAAGFFHEMAHIIDSRVMTRSRLYDDWNQWNPKDFQYGDQPADSARYLTGETRAFVDADSMHLPREDRAALMACAMESGNEALFESETMQKKLRQLCLGIRTAFDLKKTTQTLLWEQYLKTPLT